jgi:hypothetical protein
MMHNYDSRRWTIRPVFHGTNNVTVQVMYAVVHFSCHTYFERKERHTQPNFELF